MNEGGPDVSRLLHPASSAGGGMIPADALADIVAGLARVERSVPDVPRPGGVAGGLRAVAGRDGSAVAAPAPRSLPPARHRGLRRVADRLAGGTGMAHHDHGGVSVVMQVVSGGLVESVSADAGGTGRLRPLGAGCSTTLEPGRSHELWNPGTGDATSVHAYSPPLDTVTFSDPAAATRSSARPAVLDRLRAPAGAAGEARHRVRSFVGWSPKRRRRTASGRQPAVAELGRQPSG